MNSTTPKITAAEIARRTGLSPQTVGRFLRDPQSVTPATREEIRDAMPPPEIPRVSSYARSLMGMYESPKLTIAAKRLVAEVEASQRFNETFRRRGLEIDP